MLDVAAIKADGRLAAAARRNGLTDIVARTERLKTSA